MYRGLVRTARTAPFDQATPLRWRLRAGVVGRWAGDPVPGEAFGDDVQAPATEPFGEDPLHHRGGDGIGRQPMESLADGRLPRVGMRAGVGEVVAVGRTAAEEAVLGLGLGRHGGADPDLDPAALALRHAAVKAHDHVVGVGAGSTRPPTSGTHNSMP